MLINEHTFDDKSFSVTSRMGCPNLREYHSYGFILVKGRFVEIELSSSNLDACCNRLFFAYVCGFECLGKLGTIARRIFTYFSSEVVIPLL